MKTAADSPSSPTLFPRHGILATISVLALLQPAGALDDYTILADADTTVDPLVSIPQGSLDTLAVCYDPIFGSKARSFIRFDLSGVGSEIRVLEARIDLLATLAAGGGGSFQAHRSATDNWNELLMTWGGQPAHNAAILGSATVSGYGPIHQPVSIPLSDWDAVTDRKDGKVTFVLKTLETAAVGAINFSSREGASPPQLKLSLRARGDWINGDHENGLEPSVTSGSVSLVADPGDPSNTVVQLTTRSPATLSQEVDTPNGLFGLEFTAEFLTPSGSLSILFNDHEVARFDAPPTGLPGGVVVEDRSLRGLNDAVVTFRLDGPEETTSTLIIDKIGFFELPEPPLSITRVPGEAAVELSFPAEEGAGYQLWHSPDLDAWSEFGRVVGPLGLTYQTVAPLSGNKDFYRLEILAGPDCCGVDAAVLNPGFEDTVLADGASSTTIAGWTNSSGSGVWNPPSSQYGGTAAEGENIGYVHNNHSLSQTLNEELEPFRIYTLECFMGRRTDIDWPNSSGPTVVLRAGGVELSPTSADSPMPAAGQFAFWSIDYVIGKDHPQLGEALEIEIHGGTTSGYVSQVNFDDCVLEIR